MFQEKQNWLQKASLKQFILSFKNYSGAKFGCCLLPNTCLGIAVQIIARKETSQVGIKWDTISEAPSVDDSFSLGNALGVLIFDCFLYGFFTW